MKPPDIKIISGHSDNTIDTFIIPEQVEVWFLEEDDSVCYVEPTTDGLDIAMKEIEGTTYKHSSGERIKNYHITFDLSKNSVETGDVYGVLTRSKTSHKFVDEFSNDSMTLKEICDSFSESNFGNQKTILYCFFCRGEKDSFSNLASNVYFGGKHKTKRRKTKRRKTKRCKTKRRKTKR